MMKILWPLLLMIILCSCSENDNEISEENFIDFEYKVRIDDVLHEIDTVKSTFYTPSKQLGVNLKLKEVNDTSGALRNGSINFNFKLLKRTFIALEDPLAEKMSTNFHEVKMDGSKIWYSTGFGEFKCKTTVTELTENQVSIKFSGVIYDMNFRTSGTRCEISGFVKGVNYKRIPQQVIYSFP